MLLRKVLAGFLALLIGASPALSQSIQLAPGQVIGNGTSAQRPGQAAAITSVFDQAFGTTADRLFARGTSSWGGVTTQAAGWACLIQNMFGGQFIGVPVNCYGALNDGVTNNTRYIADAAVYASANRMGLIFSSGLNYRHTPIQFGGVNNDTCTFTGTIGPASTTLVITTIPTPACQLAPGMSLTGAGVSASTRITGYQGDTIGFIGSYTVNNSQTVGPITFTATAPTCTADITASTMTVASCANGALNLVDAIRGTGIIVGQTITAFGTGTGGAGTYTMAYSQPTPLVGVSIRANPYTVVDAPTSIRGAPGGETQTVLAARAGNSSPHALVKLVYAPIIGAYLGFRFSDLRLNADGSYGNGVMVHGFSSTSAGGQPIMESITVNGATGSTCGFNFIGNAPTGFGGYGIFEAKLSRLSGKTNTVCDFNFNGYTGDASHNIQAVLAERLSGNSVGTGPTFKITYSDFTCIDCLSQNPLGAPIAFDNVYHSVWTNFYSEASGSAITSTASTFGVTMTGTVVSGVSAGMLAECTNSIDIHIGAGVGTYPTNTQRNFGCSTGQHANFKGSAVTLGITASTGRVGAQSNHGLQLAGNGSVNDVTAINKSGTVACGLLTGTTQWDCLGLSVGGKTITLGGNLTLSGAFTFTGTLTGNTSVTFPTSGTLATTAGASIPSVVQGDMLYGSAPNTIVALAKDAGASRFVKNSGSLNSPAWAQPSFADLSGGTAPAFTLGGTVSGGGNQINNIVIGTTTPLAVTGTIITATSTLYASNGAAAPNGLVWKTNGGADGSAIRQGAGGAVLWSLDSVANSWSLTTSGGGGIVDYNALTASTFTISVASTFQTSVRIGTSGGKLAISATAPTISSGFCTTPSISSSNGTAAFTITIGSACAASTGVLAMPAASAGWVCNFRNVTNSATSVPDQTASTTTSVSVTNYVRTTGVAGIWTASDVISADCTAY